MLKMHYRNARESFLDTKSYGYLLANLSSTALGLMKILKYSDTWVCMDAAYMLVDGISDWQEGEESGDEQMYAFIRGNCRHHTRTQMHVTHSRTMDSRLVPFDPSETHFMLGKTFFAMCPDTCN